MPTIGFAKSLGFSLNRNPMTTIVKTTERWSFFYFVFLSNYITFVLRR